MFSSVNFLSLLSNIFSALSVIGFLISFLMFLKSEYVSKNFSPLYIYSFITIILLLLVFFLLYRDGLSNFGFSNFGFSVSGFSKDGFSNFGF
nr:MAG TPA: hypothetical protein [Caudoviricetes sp.]